MKAIGIPQPWAGLILSGQLEHINAPVSTSLRGEMAVYALRPGGQPKIQFNYKQPPPGTTDVEKAYLGFVNIKSCSDAYEVDGVAYLGKSWFWHVEPGDMLQQPVYSAVPRHAAGRVFMVPNGNRDEIDANRLGWSQWWDQRLDEMLKRQRKAQDHLIRQQANTASE